MNYPHFYISYKNTDYQWIMPKNANRCFLVFGLFL